VFETVSPMSGRVRVIDYRRERRLVVRGAILSVLPLDGDWTAVEREYWWHALTAVTFRPRPTALLVGLGGGTQAHLLARVTTPRLVTAVERDPVILEIANEWFGLRRLGPMELVCAEASHAMQTFARQRRRFDFIMEDAAYGDESERAMPLAVGLATLVAPGGTLVVNRHRRGDAHELAEALASTFEEVRLRRVRREAENVLVCCTRPIRRRRDPGSA
jgi:spermidine synthase